jgi:hypothetical protein
MENTQAASRRKPYAWHPLLSAPLLPAPGVLIRRQS